MAFDLAFTPSGRLTVRSSDAGDGTSSRRLEASVKAFASSQAEGLFTLAAQRFDAPLPPDFAYWRDFACRYLAELCHTPEGAGEEIEEVPPPGQGVLASLLLSVPPMAGAEYVSCDRLEETWRDLDTWVRGQVAAGKAGLSGFLKDHAPLWHQVGRVCFHLAENRRDPGYPFAFLATYAPGLAAGSRVKFQPLSKALEEYVGAKNKKALVKLLSPVHLASKASPLVRELVESGDMYQPLAWTPREAYRFLKEVPAFEEAGILVRLPDWWKKRPRPRVGITIGDRKQKAFDVENMLDFNVELALGDEQLSEEEWQELMAGDEGLVLLRGQWVEVDREKLAEALDHWKQVETQAVEGLSFIDGMRLLAGVPQDLDETTDEPENREWSFVNAGNWLGEILAELRDPESAEPVRAARGLKATLRPYQQVGVNWLSFMSRLGLGACLADDMGLGKTVQVLALLLALKKKPSKPSLMVLPASLLANWKAEIERFAPSLRCLFVHPSQASKEALGKMARNPSDGLEESDVVLTTYGMLLRNEWLLGVSWRLVVLDEAQAIKNPAARQTKTAKKLTADARITLTGTPVENRLSDLWSLFDFLCPGLLGSQQQFKRFVKDLAARERDRYAPLRCLVQPYILRRLKTDKRVIADLPDKTEMKAFCGLSKKQAAMYAKLVDQLDGDLKGVDGIKRRGLVLSYLMRFKQLCNHPSQLLGDGRFAADASGKFTRLAEISHEIASRQEKALVFTQFREMTDPLCEFLSEVFRENGLVLHGGTPVKRRKTLIEQFQQDSGPPFFVLSLKAGGTGLNLTAASHVIHFDRWWNPAVENQATDRAFRIGQKRNVLVHKFVCQGTVEERIDAMIEEKSKLADDLLEGGAERMLTEMTDQELVQLVSLDIERASL